MRAEHRYYRPDIDGLRAVAVISVVLFHAFPSVLPGGFIGVDIFFVISGYLISGIILRDCEQGRFRFADFYTRRVRRIFPALTAVLLFVLCLGWWTLFAKEYKSLGVQTVSAVGFISNIQFWFNSGYFDRQAELKPCLHLWSLGVEEQFYFVWPPFVLLFWRWRHLPWLIAGCGVISFAYCLFATDAHPTSAYFLPFSRFWELMAGGALALWQRRSKSSEVRAAHILSWIGVICIAIALLFINASSPFPGWRAIVPVAGAVLLIAAGQNASANRLLLSNRTAVAIGLVSYPLYLWHWPLLSFFYIMFGGVLTTLHTMVAIVLAAVLATLTYHFLEVPLRHTRPSRMSAILLTSLLAMVGVAGALVYHGAGLPERAINHFNVSDYTLSENGENIRPGCGVTDATPIAVCEHDKREQPSVALIGDSKAQAIYSALVDASVPGERWELIGGHGKYGVSPLPVITDAPEYREFQAPTHAAFDAVQRDPNIQVVVLVSATRNILKLNDRYLDDLSTSHNYAAAEAGLTRAVELLRAAGKRVVIVVDNPSLEDPELCLTRTTSSRLLNTLFRRVENPRCRIAWAFQQERTAHYRQTLERVAARYQGDVVLFDPTNMLCSQDASGCSMTRDGHALYSYADHMSDYAAGLVAPALVQAVQQLAAR